MLLCAEESQLVLIDYQARILPILHEHQPMLHNALRLARGAHLLQLPIWGTEHMPDKLGSTVEELAALYQKTLHKTHFSAVADGLDAWLRPPTTPQRPPAGNARSLPKHLQRKPQTAPERNSIVLAGCETHICLLQTALELLEAEFDVWVVTDACTSRTERNRDAAFDRLAAAGAELITTEMALYEWLRHAEHPQFRAVLNLVK